ncbi:MAG TPA: thiolase family protein [Dehalococcoidia bacterium]|nr:thiolase family protein [Dehalococcoidia bacterium]
MGLRGEAAIVGIAELKPERRPQGPFKLPIEQWADLAKRALDDAGISPREVNGICSSSSIREASMFVPATISEYLGTKVNFAEVVDLGGATAAGMVWRAAAAIELGVCDVVVCALPSMPGPQPPQADGRPRGMGFGASSANFGSPQAEFDIPYGNVAQNCSYAMIAQRYAAVYGYDPWAMAKICVDQRTNACANPAAIFYGQPITADDVLASPMIADPLHMLEIVMPVSGGAAVVLAGKERARRAKHRPVWVRGFGEHLEIKTPTYAEDIVKTPVGPAAEMAFAMAGARRSDIDLVSLYDCYTITVLLTLEDAGFCAKGEGAKFIKEHDLTYKGDFPCNTHGGQLSFGQAGLAGGMSHVTEATRQLQQRAGENQVPKADLAFVSGTGGVMSEQAALLLQGD